MEFNEGQLQGIERIGKWFKGWQDGRHRKQVFFMDGQAGTGKTSTARKGSEECAPEYRVVYIAPTGKAASRLRQKGCKLAKTLHGFAYNVRGEDEEGEPIFHEKGFLDDKPLLVVLDEASMVGQRDMQAVLRHGIPVLALGDLGQLLPVNAPQALTPEHVDHTLTQIERQKGDSNIIRGASFVRQGKRLPLREYHDVQVRSGIPPLDDLLGHVGEDSQILCSYNNTRVGTNQAIREALGYKDQLPMPGEKVMCMFNQHTYNFMNGEQGIVIGYEDIPDSVRDVEEDLADEMIYIRLRSLTDGKERRMMFNPLSFSHDLDTRKEALKGVGGFDFGYCCTVHKSQGSEWDRVLVIEEPMGDYSKLMYTAYTRAINNLRIYRR
jgi:exodeoxyribonuclease-5